MYFIIFVSFLYHYSCIIMFLEDNKNEKKSNEKSKKSKKSYEIHYIL